MVDDFPMKTNRIEIKRKAKGGKLKVIKYDRSFLSRIIQNQKAKEFYNDIKNYCLSFEKVKARTAWNAESFLTGSEATVRLVVLGDALCALFALNPADYDQKRYPHKDFSDHKEYQSTPFLVPIRTAAEYKIARRLVADAFTSRFVYTVDFPKRTNFLADLPNEKDEALIKKGLIKKTETEMTEADAKKAIASALQEEAEEEKALEGFGTAKPPKKATKKKPTSEEPEEKAALPEEEVEEVEFDLADEPEEEAALSEEETEEVEDVEFDLADEPVVIEETPNGFRIEVRYDRSFISRIIQNEKAKEYYSELKNHSLSLGLKSRVSWKADSFHYGRKTYLLLKVVGKTLYAFFALDPTLYETRIYHHRDLSDKKSYQNTPMVLRVKSDRALRIAKNLIAEMMTAAGSMAKEIPQVDYVSLYPYETTEALLEKKLIKRIEHRVDNVLTASPSLGGETAAEEPAVTEAEEPTTENIAEAPNAPEEDVEEVEFELAEPPKEENIQEEEPTPDEENDREEEDVEEVTFELAEIPVEDNAGSMESYGTEERQGKYVTLRKYIRGFAAKMRQGDQDRKDYYAEIKTRLLSYKGVKISESFSGDSYKKGARTLLKSRIRGKTLCLFFALDTDNYKQTIYRQQYKGDIKAYAATPMMVRVKSEQGLKRALRLIEEMERNYSLQAGEPASLAEIRREYLYEETSSLLEKGLIKTRLVTVTEYEAEELLKKQAK